jgi:hypothetical protein
VANPQLGPSSPTANRIAAFTGDSHLIGDPAAALDANGQRIGNGATPGAGTDFATKAYVDAASAGLSAKPSVAVASTANLTLLGEQTIDGVLTSASRVLVKNQSTASGNGIYVTGAGAWLRAADMAATTGASGAFVLVEQGTLQKGTAWVCTTASGSDVVGVNNLTFTEFDIGALTFTQLNAILATANASISVNSQKIINLANGSGAQDAMAFGQYTFTTLNALFAAANAQILVNSQNIGGVLDPTTAQQAATKNYVDTKQRAIGGPWGNVQNPGNATLRFLTLGNIATTTPSTTETTSQWIAPAPGTIRSLYVAMSASISTDSLTFVVRINGVATSVTCVLAGGTKTGNDTAHTAAFNAGDLISVSIQQASTQAAATLNIIASIGATNP